MSHDEAARLLPWLVNGTLGAAERECVELHVRDCLVCRAELREQQALQTLVRQRPDVPLSAERGFEALLSRLQEDGRAGAGAEPPRSESRTGADARSPQTARAASPFGSEPILSPSGSDPASRASQNPRMRGWGVGARRLVPARRAFRSGERFQLRLAAAAGVSVVAFGLLLWLGFRAPTEQAAAYRTLSAPEPGGVQLDVVFSPEVTEQGMREVLSGVGATIVDGPSAIGRYTIRLGPAGSSAAAVDAALRKLHADNRVRFAARSYTSNERLGEER